MTATITSKGQITIPARIRKKLGLQTGSVLHFDENAPYLKARQLFDEKEARSVLGCAKSALPGQSSESWLSATRGRRVRLSK
jgi:AbrB family looped-hinge helix DNA binding protein